jgi:hypothetical protein
MIARIAPHQIAGWLLLLPAVACIAIWYVYLFVSPPSGLSALDGALGQLRYTFSEENSHAWWWFGWLIALPVACTCLALAYLQNVSRTRTGSIALFSMVVALALAAVLLTHFSMAFLIAGPAFWGYRAIRGN